MTKREKFVYKTEYGTTTDMYLLPVGTKFEVKNGFWKGEILEVDSNKYLRMENGTMRKLDSETDYGLVISILQEKDTQKKKENKNLYLHYKGGVYEKLFEAKHTEDEEVLVIYEDAEGKKWARPKTMFEDSLVYKGETVKRFTKI